MVICHCGVSPVSSQFVLVRRTGKAPPDLCETEPQTEHGLAWKLGCPSCKPQRSRKLSRSWLLLPLGPSSCAAHKPNDLLPRSGFLAISPVLPQPESKYSWKPAGQCLLRPRQSSQLICRKNDHKLIRRFTYYVHGAYSPRGYHRAGSPFLGCRQYRRGGKFPTTDPFIGRLLWACAAAQLGVGRINCSRLPLAIPRGSPAEIPLLGGERGEGDVQCPASHTSYVQPTT